MIDIFQAIALALVQGLTEFLPISSSAHLVFPGISLNPRYFMAAAPLLLTTMVAGAASTLRPRVLVRGSAFLMILLLAAGTTRHVLEPGHGREEMYVAGSWLDANLGPDQVILVTSREMEKLARFHAG